MSLPEAEQRRAERLFKDFCEKRIPPRARDQVRMLYRITGRKVILIESRPYYADPTKWSEMPIAQFEYDISTKEWSLYAYDRNDKRLPYSKGRLEKLLEELDRDPTRIFWG